MVNDAVHQALALLAIDSPSGYTGKAAEYAYNQLKELGFDPQYSRKGAVLVNLTPHLPQEDGLLLLAHLDTLGGMVTRITGEGRSPYDYSLTSQLIAAAQKSGADYAVDNFTNYGSDADATLTAGYDIRHGLIGPGVFASHGYERSHKKGVENTLGLLISYLG